METATEAKSRPLLIVFTRDYCGPCRVMKPWLLELAEEHGNEVDVVSVNVDRKRNDNLAKFFQVSAVPMLVFADAQGNISRRKDGVSSKAQMLRTMRGLGWLE